MDRRSLYALPFRSCAVYDMLYTGPGSGVEEALVAFVKMVDQALCHQVQCGCVRACVCE